MKTIKSNIAPNPLEAQYWIDLSANKYGKVIKWWNGREWASLSGDNSSDIQNILKAMDNKVDKVSDKGLSTNDYTNTDKNKLAGLSNYNDAALRALITNIDNRLKALETA